MLAFLIAAALGGLAVGAPVSPGDGALALSWEAPQGCPTAAEVRRQVTDHLGSAQLDRPFAASMVARAQGDGYRVSIAIDDAGVHSERALSGGTCPEVASAAALIVAMTIDPRIEPRTPAPLQAPDPAATPPGTVAQPLPDPAEDRTPDPDSTASAPAQTREDARGPRPVGGTASSANDSGRARRLQFAGNVGVGVGAGPLPRAPSAVLDVGAGLRGRGWRVQGTARWWSPRVGPSISNAAVSVRAQLWDVGVAACGIVSLGRRAELPLCGTVSAGLMHAQGRGTLRAKSDQASPWAAFGVGAEFTWWSGWVGFGARARGLVTLARTVFETEPSGVAHRAGPVGGVLGAHVGVRLP